MDISVVIPVYNESGNIRPLTARITQTLQDKKLRYELIFINDGSRDNSLVILQALSASDPRIKYIDLSRNFGHQIAVSAGLDYASGQTVVIIDADLQDPPELISTLYEKWEEGFEVVYAQRSSRKGESLFKRATAKTFYRLIASITKINIPLDTGDFRIVDAYSGVIDPPIPEV